MHAKRVPVVNVTITVNRALILLMAIVLGILLSVSTAEAGKKIEKEPFNKGILKKKNHTYSCKVLMGKHRSTTNISVKTSARRPKWR